MKMYQYACCCFLLLLLSAIEKASYAQQLTPAMKAKFDQLIDARYKANEPGGTVLLAQKGKVLYARGFGMANLELNVKMQPAMLFEIGSQTKQFTAICILQLMEQGKLDVTDPIAKYIEHSPETWQKITIEHLMTHSSGISDVRNRPASDSETIEVAKKQPLAYPPGSKTFYANIEFMLLGMILEKVSGESVGNYMKAHILEPLGMKHTYCNENDAVIPDRTPAYLKRSNGSFSNTFSINAVGGAGGLISNTYDMLTWYEALAAGKVVKKETLAQAWKPYLLTDGKPSKYGYGWGAGGTVQGSPIIEHGGVARGYCTESFYMPKEQVFVAVFLNQRNYADPTAQELAAIFIGKPYPLDSIQLSEEELKAFAGTYDIGEGNKRTITLSNGVLTYNGTPKLQLIHYAKDKFYLENTMLSGTVRRDEQGKITTLELIDNRFPSFPATIWRKIE